MNAQINQRGRHGKYHLPKNWRAVESDAGELLYVIRICDRYWCRIEYGRWRAFGGVSCDGVMTGVCIGEGPTMDHALLACREHLHSAASAAGE